MRPLILLFSLGMLIASCSRKMTQIALTHDKSVSLPMSNELTIGATFAYSKGKEKKTKSLLQGSRGWHGLTVDIKGGTFKNGLLLIDYAAAIQNGYKISITCTHKKHPEIISHYEIPIPKIHSLRIQPLITPVAPGIPTALKFQMKFDNGKNFSTHTGSDFRFLKDLHIAYLGNEHTANNPMYIPRKSTKYEDSIAINCYFKTASSPIGVDYVPVHYKASYELSISGTAGNNGDSGQDGDDDINGQHGQHGRWGDHGGSIPPLQVWISVVDSAKHLATVVTNIESHVEYYILDYSSQAQVAINAKGGRGGNGGKGGSGGDGSDEIEKRAAGKGGDGGDGGHGGDGGDGADVTIHVEEGFQFLTKQLLLIDQSGGLGGKKGEGGKGGRNGNKLKPSKGSLLLKILGIERGNNGREGNDGKQGRKGITKTIPLPHETILQGIGQLAD